MKFDASQFTPTEHSSAEEKAKFASHFMRFVESGFKKDLFQKWFYNRLMHTFGHIAHYDIHGFWDTWFETAQDRVNFLKNALRHPSYGSPGFTYCDVEKAIKMALRVGGYLEKYEKILAGETEASERAELARLKEKYEK